LPLHALEMALWTRARAGHDDNGVIHHSDAGPAQYTAIRYANRLANAGAVASIGSVGDSYDNTLAESVIGLYKLECVRRVVIGIAVPAGSRPTWPPAPSPAPPAVAGCARGATPEHAGSAT
jgi:transposase InsO family protein